MFFSAFSVKYFINSVAFINAGLAIWSLNKTSISPSPKYSPSETKKVILRLPLVGFGLLGLSQAPICSTILLLFSNSFPVILFEPSSSFFSQTKIFPV
ncbi:hypothetical protein MHTCC0001_27260 [Flavobacteriaceae bacterium MHTCC 0001]